MCRWYEYKSGTAYNKRVSGFVPSALRPNPRLSARPSDTRQPLSHVAESLKMIDIFGIMITIHGEGGNKMLETLCEIVLYGDENEPSQI